MTCSFKYDMRNFVNFHPTTQKFQNFTSMRYFCPKYMRFELKNTEELSFMTLKQNSENLHFDWILLPTTYKDLDEKIQKSYVS